MGISIATQISITPTITAGAYDDGDALGGRLDLANAVNPHAQSGAITNITVIDKANQGVAIDVFLFDAEFAPTADNEAWPTTSPTETAISTNCIGVVSIASGDYVAYSGGKIAEVVLHTPFKLTAGTTLYGQAVVRDTPTYGAASDLIFKFTIAKD